MRISLNLSVQELIDLWFAVRRNICEGNRSQADLLEPLVYANLPEIVQVPLTRGYYATIDRDDFKKVARYNWFVMETKATGGNNCIYAGTRIPGVGVRQTTLRLHRLITEAGDDVMVDHRDSDGLNNCRSNLRIATRTENRRNSRKKIGGSSRFLGVSIDAARVKAGKKEIWQVSIQKGRIGVFQTEEEAARAYDREAKARYGEFASLNFPDEKAA